MLISTYISLSFCFLFLDLETLDLLGSLHLHLHFTLFSFVSHTSMQSQSIDDVINDNSKQLHSIYQLESESDEIPLEFKDSKYFSETDYINYLKQNKVDDNNTLKIITLNIANVLSKLSNLKLFINNLSDRSNKPSIIVLTETHLKDGINHGYSPKELTDILPGYKFFHRDRKIRGGGGVGVFVVDVLAGLVKVESMDVYEEEIFESITIRIPGINFEQRTKDLVLLSVYRQPKNDNVGRFLQLMNCWLTRYDKRTNEMCITGDMNLDLLKYEIHAQTAEYLDIMLSHSMLPVITRPTRIKHSSATLIDHIFLGLTNLTSGIICTEIAGSHGFTDHYPVFCTLKIRKDCTRPKKTVTSKYFTLDGHKNRREGLKNEDWSEIYAENDPNLIFNSFQNKYCTHYHDFLTIREYEAKWGEYRREPWMTNDILKKIKKRDRLIKQKERRNDYKQVRNEIVSDCRKAERSYLKKKISECWNDVKGHWNILKKVMGKINDKSDIPTAFQCGDTMISDKKEIANHMNDYYSKVGPDTNRSVGQSSKGPNFYLEKNKARMMETLMFEEFDINQVIEACRQINPKTSCDAFGLQQKVVLSDMDILAPIFTHLINCSVSAGIFPEGCKVSRVIPVYKQKGENYLCSNYRPISLIPVFSKILEKLVYNKIFHFLVRYQILFKSQYGFRKGHNTTHATIDFLQTIETAMLNNEFAIGVFCDLSKAFDTLDHEILLSKLDHYGIRGCWLSWFRSYLSNREQFVDMNGVRSEMKKITVGVPQGSILGPLLFLIYINDLPSALTKMIAIMFADDTNLVIRGKDLKELSKILNSELSSLSDYFCANKLKLNAGKTKLVCFRKKGSNFEPSDLSVTIDNQTLELGKNATFLGLTLDEHLTWEDHSIAVANKMARNNGILNRVKKFLPSSSLQTIYHSLIATHYQYGLEVWGGSKSKGMKRITGIQKKSVRVITKSHWLAHSEPRMKALRVLKVADQYQLQCSSLVFDMIKGFCPDIYKYRQLLNENRNSYGLRSTTQQPQNLRQLPNNTNQRTKNFANNGPHFWNELPEEIKISSTRKEFKSRTKRHLLEKYTTHCDCSNPLCRDRHFHTSALT